MMLNDEARSTSYETGEMQIEPSFCENVYKKSFGQLETNQNFSDVLPPSLKMDIHNYENKFCENTSSLNQHSLSLNNQCGSEGLDAKYFKYLFNQTTCSSHNGLVNKLKTNCASSARIWHERPTTSIQSLYPELLALIFQHLSVRDKGRVAQVCTTWRDAAYEKSVWRNVEVKLHLRRKSTVVLKSLVQRGIKNIQVLSLHRNLVELTENVPKLESLVLTGCFNLTNEKLISSLNNNLVNLKTLNLSMCKQITDSAIIHISKHLFNLQVLDLGGCCNLTDRCLVSVVQGLKQLKSLNLRSCRNITDAGLAKLCGRRSVVSGSTELLNVDASLRFHHSHHNQQRNRLNYEDYLRQNYLPDNDIAIEDLDLDFNSEYSIVDKSLSLNQLEVLGLQDCQKITDDGLRFVPAGLSQLKNINLSFCSGITEFGLKYLANSIDLETINLRSCNNIGDIGLRFLSEANLTKLINLDVSFCEKVNDQALSYIASGLKELQILCLNSCSITDVGLIKIAQNLLNLSTLNVGQCTRLTDKSLNILADNCTKLCSIDLYGCTRITTICIERLIQLPHLNKLNLGLQNNYNLVNSISNNLNPNLNNHNYNLDNSQQQEATIDENNNYAERNRNDTILALTRAQFQVDSQEDQRLQANYNLIINAAAVNAAANAYVYAHQLEMLNHPAHFSLPFSSNRIPSHLNHHQHPSPSPSNTSFVNNITINNSVAGNSQSSNKAKSLKRKKKKTVFASPRDYLYPISYLNNEVDKFLNTLYQDFY